MGAVTQFDPDLLKWVADIVAAHATHNAVAVEALPELIQSVYAALVDLGRWPSNGAPSDQRQPAVPIKKSVFPGYIVCLEDGKKLTMLKRHLSVIYDLTPTQYRERWGLPKGYPMVAPDYAARRSVLAKAIGLGRKPDVAAAAPEVPIRRVPEGVKGKRSKRNASIC